MSVLSLTQSSFSKTKPVSYFAVLWLVLAWASVPELYLVGFLNLFIYKDLFIIYLFYLFLAESGLSCSTRDLSLGRSDSSLGVCGLLSSCALRVFSSLVVVHSLQSGGLCSLRHMGSSWGTQAQ